MRENPKLLSVVFIGLFTGLTAVTARFFPDTVETVIGSIRTWLTSCGLDFADLLLFASVLLPLVPLVRVIAGGFAERRRLAKEAKARAEERARTPDAEWVRKLIERLPRLTLRPDTKSVVLADGNVTIRVATREVLDAASKSFRKMSYLTEVWLTPDGWVKTDVLSLVTEKDRNLLLEAIQTNLDARAKAAAEISNVLCQDVCTAWLKQVNQE